MPTYPHPQDTALAAAPPAPPHVGINPADDTQHALAQLFVAAAHRHDQQAAQDRQAAADRALQARNAHD